MEIQPLNIIEHHWTSLNIIEHHWTSLNIIEHHWTSLNIIEHHWTSLNIIELQKASKNHVFSSNGANLALVPPGSEARHLPLEGANPWGGGGTEEPRWPLEMRGQPRGSWWQFSGSKDLRNYSSIWSYLLFRFEQGQLYSCWPGSRQSIVTKRMVLVFKIYSFWCLRMFEGVHFWTITSYSSGPAWALVTSCDTEANFSLVTSSGPGTQRPEDLEDLWQTPMLSTRSKEPLDIHGIWCWPLHSDRDW